MSDKAFGLDVAIAQDEKRLLELQGTRGAGREITATTKHLEDLKKQRDLLSKEQFLTFEPDRRILNRMANPVTEIAPDAAKAAILELLGQMPGLAAAAGEKSLNVGGVTVQLNGVTGENLVEKSQTAAEVILNAIRNARNSGTRYQGAASPQLSGGG